MTMKDMDTYHTFEGFMAMVEGADLERIKKKFADKGEKRQNAIDKKKSLENQTEFSFSEQMQEEKKKLEKEVEIFREKIRNGELDEDDVNDVNDMNDATEGNENENENERPATDFDLKNLHGLDTSDKDKDYLYFLILPADGLIDSELKTLETNLQVIGESLNMVATVFGETIAKRREIDMKRSQIDRMELYIKAILSKSGGSRNLADNLLKTAFGFGTFDDGRTIGQYGKSIYSRVIKNVKTRNMYDIEDTKDIIDFFADELQDQPSITLLNKKAEVMKRSISDIQDEVQGFSEAWGELDSSIKLPEWDMAIEKVQDMTRKTFNPLLDLLLDIENFYVSDIRTIVQKYDIEGLGEAVEKYLQENRFGGRDVNGGLNGPVNGVLNGGLNGGLNGVLNGGPNNPLEGYADEDDAPDGGSLNTVSKIENSDSRVRVDDFNALRELVVRAVMIVQKLEGETKRVQEQIKETVRSHALYEESVKRMNENIRDAITQLVTQDEAVDAISRLLHSNGDPKLPRKVNELRNIQTKMIKEVERLQTVPDLFLYGIDDDFGDGGGEEEEVVEEEVICEEECEDEVIEMFEEGRPDQRVFVEEEEDVFVEEEGEESWFVREFQVLMRLNKKSRDLSREISEDYGAIHREARDIKDFGDAFHTTMKDLQRDWGEDFYARLLDYQTEIQKMEQEFDIYEDKVLNTYDGSGITLIRIEEFLGKSKDEILTKYEDDDMLSIYIDIMAVNGDGNSITIVELDKKVNILALQILKEKENGDGDDDGDGDEDDDGDDGDEDDGDGDEE